MRTLWAIRPLVALADLAVLRCTRLGPQGPFPPRGRGGGHSFAVAVAMPLFSLLVITFGITPANRKALARFAVRCGLTHVRVQLSDVPQLAGPTVQADGKTRRDIWAAIARLMSPTPSSEGTSADACSRAGGADCASPFRPVPVEPSEPSCRASTAKAPPGVGPYLQDFEGEGGTTDVSSPLQRTRPDAVPVADRPQRYRFPDRSDSSNYETHSRLSGFSSVVGSSGSSVGVKPSSEWDDEDSQIEGEYV